MKFNLYADTADKGEMPFKYLYSFAFLLMGGLSAYATESASCPANADQLRSLTDAQIRTYCAPSSNARQVAESFPRSHVSLRQCVASLTQARESARVVYAVSRRQQVRPPATGALSQATAFLAAMRNLLRAHNYTNISLAAVYRSRLKLRQAFSRTTRYAEEVRGDYNRVAQASAQPPSRRVDPSVPNPQIRQATTLRGLHENLLLARSCLTTMQAPLDRAFEDWRRVKQNLLQQNLETLAGGVEGPTTDRNSAVVEARSIQTQQQYVYDVLTDPSQRDFAYQLAEGCEENSCVSWASGASVVGQVARTPVLGTATSAISTALAGDRAMRHGLSLGQQFREAANAAIGYRVLETAIGRVENGEADPYEP